MKAQLKTSEAGEQRGILPSNNPYSKESLQTKSSLNQSKEFKQTMNGKVEIETFNMEIKTYLNWTHKKVMIADLSKMKNGDDEYLRSCKPKSEELYLINIDFHVFMVELH